MDRADLDRNFGFLVHDVARLMRVVFDRRGKELGLTRSQWYVLTMLYANEGATQSELADLMDLEKPTLGRLLDRLEEKDWIERRGDSEDRRVRRVHLTGRVQGLMRRLRGIAGDIRLDALRGLDPAEREQFVETLIKIKSNLMALDGMRNEGNGRAAADD